MLVILSSGMDIRRRIEDVHPSRCDSYTRIMGGHWTSNLNHSQFAISFLISGIRAFSPSCPFVTSNYINICCWAVREIGLLSTMAMMDVLNLRFSSNKLPMTILRKRLRITRQWRCSYVQCSWGRDCGRDLLPSCWFRYAFIESKN